MFIDPALNSRLYFIQCALTPFPTLPTDPGPVTSVAPVYVLSTPSIHTRTWLITSPVQPPVLDPHEIRDWELSSMFQALWGFTDNRACLLGLRNYAVPLSGKFDVNEYI